MADISKSNLDLSIFLDLDKSAPSQKSSDIEEPPRPVGASGTNDPIYDGKKRPYFSFSHSQAVLRTGGREYYALFRNQNMDLEKLKTERENIWPFVFPLVQYFTDRNIKNVVIAPRGDRYKKNGFHFVSDLMARVSQFSEIVVHSPFRKVGDKIDLLQTDIPPAAIIFDDIITRGTTINRMVELYPAYKDILILICNH